MRSLEANPTYAFLLSAPSFSMPSHPTALPAASSNLPMPSFCGFRLALAAFIASIPSVLSDSADDFHSSEPVTLPTVLCSDLIQCVPEEVLLLRCRDEDRTSTAPFTYWAWPPMRVGLLD